MGSSKWVLDRQIYFKGYGKACIAAPVILCGLLPVLLSAKNKSDRKGLGWLLYALLNLHVPL